MTHNTSYREKGRAVFLAAIMVLSMVAGAAVLAGSAAAEHEPGETEVAYGNLGDESRWSGQVLNITGLAGDTTVEFEHEDGQFDQVESNGNGDVTFDTEGWSAGEITVDDGTNNATFTLREQTIDTFAFDSNSVGADGTADLTIDSNRANYNVTISADGLDGGDLEDIFGNADGYNTSTHTGEDSVVVAGEQTVTAEFGGIDAGDYTFEMEVADTGVTASTNLSVEEGAETDATFDAQQYSGVVGDNMEFTIQPSSQPGDVWLNVSADGGYYDATLHLSGVSTDPVTVTWNTHNASLDSENLGFTAENATVTDVNTSSGAAIGQGSHLVNQQADFEFETFVEDPTDDGEFRDVAAVRLNERSTDGATVLTAPGVGGDGYTPADVEGALGAATPADTIAAEDLTIVQVEASGIYGYMNTSVAGFNESGLNMSLSQTTSGPYGGATSVDIQDLAAASIVPQPDNGMFYVLIDSGALEAQGLETGQNWDAEFTVGESNPYVDSEESVNDSFDYAERSIEFTGLNDNDELQLSANSDVELAAETNVAPGTTVSSRLNFPFEFVTASGEVAADGTFAETVDLSGFDQGTQFSARVRAPDGNTEATADGVVGEGVNPSFAVTGDAPGSVEVGGDAALEYTITNDGEAAGTVNYSVSIDGEQVDSGSMELAAGNSTTGTYDIDTSEAGDVSWSVETQHDSATGTVTVANASDGTGDGDGSADEGDDGNESDDGGDGGQPGFGLVVALFALIGAALLALRRQN